MIPRIPLSTWAKRRDDVLMERIRSMYVMRSEELEAVDNLLSSEIERHWRLVDRIQSVEVRREKEANQRNVMKRNIEATYFNALAASNVYVIPAKELVKVGMSDCVEQRLCSLKCDNPHVEPPYFISGKLLECRKIELGAHALLREHHYSGEWFTCSPEEAAQAVRDSFDNWAKNLDMTSRPTDIKAREPRSRRSA